MPPQFLDSPSERHNVVWQRIPLFGFFACGSFFILALSCGLLAFIGQALPTINLPITGQTLTWFGVSVWLFIAAILQAIDIQNGTAVPSKGGTKPISPLLMGIGGVIFFVVGVFSL